MRPQTPGLYTPGQEYKDQEFEASITFKATARLSREASLQGDKNRLINHVAAMCFKGMMQIKLAPIHEFRHRLLSQGIAFTMEEVQMIDELVDQLVKSLERGYTIQADCDL